MQIKVDGLHKSYHDGIGRLHILQGLSFETNKGATVAITGASGTGKSTFLHLLGGLDTADEGSIVIENQNLSALSQEDCAVFRNQTLGFIFQFHHLLQDFTSLENVMMPMLIGKQSRMAAKDNALRLLHEVGLSERKHHKPAQLSGGEQQRVAIARALANAPKIVLADEPTGNLDKENGEHIMEILLQLNQQYGITMVMITHNSYLAALMQYQYHMENGVLHPRHD